MMKDKVKCAKCNEQAAPGTTVHELSEEGWAVEYQYVGYYGKRRRIAIWLCPHCANAY